MERFLFLLLLYSYYEGRRFQRLTKESHIHIYIYIFRRSKNHVTFNFSQSMIQSDRFLFLIKILVYISINSYRRDFYLVRNFWIFTEKKKKRTVILPWNENSDSGDFPVIPVCTFLYSSYFSNFHDFVSLTNCGLQQPVLYITECVYVDCVPRHT